MTSVLGFGLRGADNDSYYYEFGEGVPACKTCGLVTRLDWLNPAFHLERTEYDFSFTWDLAPIVSDRFVDFAGSYPGARFLPLPSAPGFALFVVDPIVALDPERRGRKFEDPCPACGRYTQIAAGRIHLKDAAVLPKGFSRTDVEFGSRNERPDRFIAQSPRRLVDPQLGEALAAQGFVGLRLEPIEG